MNVIISTKYNGQRHYEGVTAIRYADIGVDTRLVIEQGARIHTIGMTLIRKVEITQGDKT